jgi:hypothetical protein
MTTRTRDRNRLVPALLALALLLGSAGTAVAAPAPGDEARDEAFRAEMLVLVERYRAFAPLVDDPAFDEALDRLEARIAAFPAEGLPVLEAGFRRQAPAWREQLAGGAPPPQAATTAEKLIFGACDGDCGLLDFDCLEEEISCDFNLVTDEISRLGGLIDSAVNGFFGDIADVYEDLGALPGQIEGFFTGLVSDLENQLTATLSSLSGEIADLLGVSSPADALSLLGLDGLDASFFEDLAESVPTLDLPCPDMDTEIPGIGTVGSARAEYACARGIDWVAGMIYDVVPDDVLDLPVKIPATFVYYPINYFCLCMEAQSALSFHGAQDDHRAHVATHLDARLGTRATGLSVDALQLTLETLPPEIAALAGSVGGTQDGVDDLDADVARVEGKVDARLADAASIDASQDEQLDLMEAFQEMELRLDVEEALLADPSRPIGALQLPADLDGYLDTVREVVVDAIAMSTVAGGSTQQAEKELSRGDAARGATEWEDAFDHYRKAYAAVTR